MLKHSFYRPRYKKLLNIKINPSLKKKIIKFKKKKWQKYKSQLSRLNIKSTRNCYYQFHDHYSFYIPRFSNKFFNNYKQKIKNNRSFHLQYGFLARNYIKTLVKSIFLKKKLNPRFIFIGILESRLDVMLLRTNFVVTIRNARQIISHGHVKVNGDIVTCCSYLLKKGDKITFRKEVHSLISYNLANLSMWPLPVKYVQVSYKIFQIIVLENIETFNLSNNFAVWLDWQSIIQSYTR